LSREASFKRRRAAAGFTLIEVVVALAIVAMSLVAIGSLIATTVRGTRSLDRHIALIETARAIETGLPDRDQLNIGSFSGETAGHRWRVDVMPFPTKPVDARQSEPWIPQAVVIRVESPSGAIIRVDNIRLRKKAVQ
jgi:general secretion pathway protein I